MSESFWSVWSAGKRPLSVPVRERLNERPTGASRARVNYTSGGPAAACGYLRRASPDRSACPPQSPYSPGNPPTHARQRSGRGTHMFIQRVIRGQSRRPLTVWRGKQPEGEAARHAKKRAGRSKRHGATRGLAWSPARTSTSVCASETSGSVGVEGALTRASLNGLVGRQTCRAARAATSTPPSAGARIKA